MKINPSLIGQHDTDLVKLLAYCIEQDIEPSAYLSPDVQWHDLLAEWIRNGHVLAGDDGHLSFTVPVMVNDDLYGIARTMVNLYPKARSSDIEDVMARLTQLHEHRSLEGITEQSVKEALTKYVKAEGRRGARYLKRLTNFIWDPSLQESLLRTWITL